MAVNIVVPPDEVAWLVGKAYFRLLCHVRMRIILDYLTHVPKADYQPKIRLYVQILKFFLIRQKNMKNSIFQPFCIFKNILS